MKRKYVGNHERNRNGFSRSPILLLDFFRNYSTNIAGFKIHKPANPVAEAKMIVETIMFTERIGLHLPEVYLENLS